MSKWTQLQHAADLLPGEKIPRDIWALGEHPSMPALLALLNDVRFARMAQGASGATAADHGILAHCMGAVDAIDEIQRRLESMIEPPPAEEENK